MSMTYLELLQKVAEGTQPRKVRMMNKTYDWDGVDYTDEAGISLAEDMGSWIVNAHAKADIIVDADILTNEERNWLAVVVTPFVEQVQYITKLKDIINEECEYIVIHYEEDTSPDGEDLYFPDFEAGTKFKGMMLGVDYTVKELDL